MTNIRLDHFLTFTSAANIDDYIKEYAAQGFLPAESTVRHEPGLRNGSDLGERRRRAVG